MKRVCVFCASASGLRPVYTEAARALGRLLAGRGIGLVYGGGNAGLMGELANATLAAGGEVVGVIPRGLVAREAAHGGLTRLEVVETMHERKRLMHQLAQAFIALPGGFGTLEELLEALTWSQLGIHEKPCGIINIDGFYDPLIALVERAVREGLIRPENRALLLAEETPVALLERLSTWRAPALPKWLEVAET